MQPGDKVQTNKAIEGPPAFPKGTTGKVLSIDQGSSVLVQLDPQENNVTATFDINDLEKI